MPLQMLGQGLVGLMNFRQFLKETEMNEEKELEKPMNLLRLDLEHSMLLLPGVPVYATKNLVDSCKTLKDLPQEEEGK